MKLFIDTSEIYTAKVAIDEFKKESQSQKLKSQMVLPLIEEIFQEHGITFKDITDVEVALGPGSFTGLRVGATVANALGFLLGIPVNGKNTLVIPQY